MIPVGSKIFFGFASLFAAVLGIELLVHQLSPGVYVFGLDTTQSMVMLSAAVACAFLGGLFAFLRDGDVAPSAEPLATPLVSGSIWPWVFGLSVTLIALGLVTNTLLVGFGALVLLIAGSEWLVRSWADRSSSDPLHNANLQKRFLHPLEFPLLGVVIVGFIMFSVSRIMLSLPELQAMTIFGGIAALVVMFGVLFSLRSVWKRSLIVAVFGFGAFGMLGLAIVGLVRGEHHEKEEVAEVEREGAKAVANKANPFATVRATPLGIELSHDGKTLEKLFVPRALSTNLLFRNVTGEKAKLVVESVKIVTNAEGTSTVERDEISTEFIGEGKVKMLTISVPRASSDHPFVMKVVTESGLVLDKNFVVQ
jgi:hypothetical protein